MSTANSRRPPPTKPELYSTALLISALTQAKGMIAVAARLLGCSRQTIYNAMERHPEIKEVVSDERELFLDTVDLKLIDAVQKGEPWAITLVLKTIGQKRGYIERQEHHVTGGATLEDLVLETAANGRAINGRSVPKGGVGTA